MDSRNGNAAITAAAAAAASPLLQRPPALLALPELDRPPATMDLWELEAVAAALPAKKRRLRETFDRLAACSPAPLPFRWDDLDNYISSLQYSVTLRHRQLRELGMSRPVPPLPPPAPAVPSASAAAADESHQMRFLEESRAVPAPVLAPPAVSEPVANTGGEVHTLGALVKSEPVDDDPAAPSPVAVSAPAAATCVDVVESGKKRKASSHQEKETEAIDAAAARVQEEAQAAEMRKRWQGMRKRRRAARALEAQAAVIRKTREEEDAAAAAEKAAASPLQQDDMNCNGEKLIPAPPSQDTNCNGNSNNLDGHDGHAARAATPCRPGLGSGNDLPVNAVTTQMDTDPIHKITTVRHECPAATPPMVSSLWLADKVPKQEPDVEAMETVESEQRKVELPNDEVPDVEMEIVEPEEVQEDAPAVADDDNKASPPQAKPREVSPLPPLACSNGGLAQTAGARSTTATATPMNADACATVCQRSPPAGTHDAPEHVRVSGGAPKSAAVHAATIEPATRRDVSATDDHHNVSAATGREATGPSQARASPKATDKRVLQKQHMPKQGYHGRTFSSSHQNQNHSFSRNNHGGRPSPTVSHQPVPEAHAAAAAQWSRPGGEGRGGPRQGGVETARGLQGDVSRSMSNAKGNKPPMFCTKCGCKGHLAENCRTAKHLFCNKCGCKGHLAETCRTAKHLVALYQKAMTEREDNQICYRCGCTGHWSRKCRTPKHLVDLYQKDRAAKLAARGTAANYI